MLEIFLKWAIPFVCGGVIAGLGVALKTTKKKNHAIEDGVQCLLRAEIIRSHDKYTERGYCTIYAKEALQRAYTAYHVLHGNDVAEKLYDDTMRLPEERKGGADEITV